MKTFSKIAPSPAMWEGLSEIPRTEGRRHLLRSFDDKLFGEKSQRKERHNERVVHRGRKPNQSDRQYHLYTTPVNV